MCWCLIDWYEPHINSTPLAIQLQMQYNFRTPAAAAQHAQYGSIPTSVLRHCIIGFTTYATSLLLVGPDVMLLASGNLLNTRSVIGSSHKEHHCVLLAFRLLICLSVSEHCRRQHAKLGGSQATQAGASPGIMTPPLSCAA